MPDIACKAVFVVHLPPGFLILLWDVHAARLAIYFLKFSLPQTPLSSSRSVAPLPAPRLLDSLQAWGRGGGLCSLKTTLPWEFPVAVSHGQAPSSRWKHRHPPPRAQVKPQTRARNAEARRPPRPRGRPPALPSLPLLRSRRREPGCWIQSLLPVLHFHKRAAARRG